MEIGGGIFLRFLVFGTQLVEICYDGGVEEEEVGGVGPVELGEAVGHSMESVGGDWCVCVRVLLWYCVSSYLVRTK